MRRAKSGEYFANLNLPPLPLPDPEPMELSLPLPLSDPEILSEPETQQEEIEITAVNSPKVPSVSTSSKRTTKSNHPTIVNPASISSVVPTESPTATSKSETLILCRTLAHNTNFTFAILDIFPYAIAIVPINFSYISSQMLTLKLRKRSVKNRRRPSLDSKSWMTLPKRQSL